MGIKKIKILFVTRTFPPLVGGMENMSFELSVHLPKFAEVKTIANTRGKIFLPLFMPYALMRTLILALRFDAILLGDGVMAIVGSAIKLIYRHKVKVVSIIHALDITYPRRIYQKLWLGKFIPSLDKLIAVGNEAIKQGVERGVPKDKFVFIPNGVDAEKFAGDYSRKNLEELLGMTLNDKQVILTFGRLAKRKGVAWFVENVMPKLAPSVIYLIAGEGPDRPNIEKAIGKNKLDGRVRMLGFQSDKERNLLLNTADLFVQPNIPVPGDAEGFGISMIEANSCALPVVASRLEGIRDAIRDGENGYLIEPCDAEGFRKIISELLGDSDRLKQLGENSQRFMRENFNWDHIARRYIKELEFIISPK